MLHALAELFNLVVLETLLSQIKVFLVVWGFLEKFKEDF